MKFGHSIIGQSARLMALNPLQSGNGRLQSLGDFGSNPGALGARIYVPEDLPENAPLVVVLHGCTQDVSSYDSCAGWSDLADTHGFALLFPEQQRANNANLCFNWFVPGDMRRGDGEPLSIVQMVAAMVARHGVDRQRVFVTGLSAGGAMTAVLLATYPEIFAGGAIIAGLPFGAATSMQEAFQAMQGATRHDVSDLAERVRRAAPPPSHWPTLSVWHGSADRTVALSNKAAIVDAWLALQGLEHTPPRHEIVDGHQRSAWSDANGREVVEAYEIKGLGHGVPLATTGAPALGKPGPYMLEAGISSTRRIAAFWGIADAAGAVVAKGETPKPRARRIPPEAPAAPSPAPASAGNHVADFINNALRAAGLQR